MKQIINFLLSLTWLACCLPILQSCAGSKSDNKVTVKQISLAELVKNDVDTIGFGIDKTELIPLETSSECLIDMVRKIIPYKDDYYIQTSSSVFKFSGDGKFITNFSCRGNAAGEYLMLDNFCILRDSLYIFDSNKEKIIAFDLSGNFIREINDALDTKFMIGIEPLTSETALIANGINFDDQKNLYAVWNPDDPKRLIPIMTTDLTSKGNYSFSNHAMTNSGNGILFFKPFGDEIYEYDPREDKVATVFKIDGIGYATDNTKDYSELLGLALGSGSELILNLFDTERYLIINLYKGSIILDKTDERGCLLESNYHTPSDGIVPFYPLLASQASGDQIISVRPASDLINIDDSNPESAKYIERLNLTMDSNPVIVKYTMR